MIFRAVKNALKKRLGWRRIPPEARNEKQRDAIGVPEHDPGIDSVASACIAWLKRAQDMSRTQDGGVARNFSLIDGWAPSYPETTGYIIPTMLDCASRFEDPSLADRARRMLDWLVEIQHHEGGFQGGVIGAPNPVPVTFNTGQILIGLAAGVSKFGNNYSPAMKSAADWLCETQDEDGCWRNNATPYAHPGEKTYETHVAWGLFEAARLEPDQPYGNKGIENVRWAIGAQNPNGWMDRCCLTDSQNPLTHTLGYALRGILEAFRFSEDEFFLEAGLNLADGLLSAQASNGRLPGRLNANWQPAVEWACLTGISQIAHCWILLYLATRKEHYLAAARIANAYVRRTICIDGRADVLGGVKGSFPIDGEYGPFEYLNWACKFTIDANLLEQQVC